MLTADLRILVVDTGRVWWRLLPQILAIYLLGWLGSELTLRVAVILGDISPWLALILFAFNFLCVLVAAGIRGHRDGPLGRRRGRGHRGARRADRSAGGSVRVCEGGRSRRSGGQHWSPEARQAAAQTAGNTMRPGLASAPVCRDSTRR